MIWDSQPWRQELAKVADRLESRQTQRRWTERTMFLIERDVMVSAYAIRKLNEARKVSDRLNALPIHVTRHKLIGRVPDAYSDELDVYDLEHIERTTLTLSRLCNQFIHSFIFTQSYSEEGNWIGIAVASDYDKRKALYVISIPMLVETFRRVAYEDVYSIRMTTNEHGERVWHDILGRDVRYESLPE